MTILIVEDNPANQLLVSAVLEREGYRLELAGSAVEARQVLARGLPDLILMDRPVGRTPASRPARAGMRDMSGNPDGSRSSPGRFATGLLTLRYIDGT